MKQNLLLFICFLFLLTGCQKSNSGNRSRVEIETTEGDIVIELYNETPRHRDNFIHLVSEGFYNDLLFHRVIKDFMIQGGDPDSKSAPQDTLLGTNDTGELIDAEIRYPRYFHKRGALAAAREEDRLNPMKKSSGSQFYLVWGKTFTPTQLSELERSQNEKILQAKINQLFAANEEQISRTESSDDLTALQQLMDSLRTEAKNRIEAEGIHYSIPDSIRQIYQTIGGTPWLDNQYTVFGEVIEGLEVIEKIQSLPTDANGRPFKDIKMTITLLK